MSTGKYDPRKFYVYVYLDPLEPGLFTCDDTSFKYRPIYVGKGCGKRIFQHVEDAKQPAKKSNREKLDLIRRIMDSGDNPLIFKVKEGITNNEALSLERELIDTFGINLEGGILANIRTGGVFHKRGNNTVDFVRIVLEEEKERLHKSVKRYLDELNELPRSKLENRAIIQKELHTTQSLLGDIERAIYFLDLYFDYGYRSVSDEDSTLKSVPEINGQSPCPPNEPWPANRRSGSSAG
jgi:hypothetical protein